MLINPIPYGDGVLSDKTPELVDVRSMLVAVDADMFIYQAGFGVEHNEPIVYDKEGELISRFPGKQKMNQWFKKEKRDADDFDIDIYSWQEPISHAIQKVKNKATKITEATQGARQIWYLTKGSTLVRNQDATIQAYKGNRVGEKPVYYDGIREYCVNYLGAKIPDGIEADDICAHLLRKYYARCIVVSGDKDLRTVPGWHMKPEGKDYEIEWVSPLQACRNLYAQMLSGDRCDNIKGLSGTIQNPGVGVKKAAEAMMPYVTEADMAHAVAVAYQERYPNGVMNTNNEHLTWQDILVENANLLFLRLDPETRFHWRD